MGGCFATCSILRVWFRWYLSIDFLVSMWCADKGLINLKWVKAMLNKEGWENMISISHTCTDWCWLSALVVLVSHAYLNPSRFSSQAVLNHVLHHTYMSWFLFIPGDCNYMHLYFPKFLVKWYLLYNWTLDLYCFQEETTSVNNVLFSRKKRLWIDHRTYVSLK